MVFSMDERNLVFLRFSHLSCDSVYISPWWHSSFFFSDSKRLFKQPKILDFYVVHADQTSIHVWHDSTSRFDQTRPPTRPVHPAMTSQRRWGSNISEGTAERNSKKKNTSKKQVARPLRSININPWLVYFLSWNIHSCFFCLFQEKQNKLAGEETDAHRKNLTPPHFPFCLMNICSRALFLFSTVTSGAQPGRAFLSHISLSRLSKTRAGNFSSKALCGGCALEEGHDFANDIFGRPTEGRQLSLSLHCCHRNIYFIYFWITWPK